MATGVGPRTMARKEVPDGSSPLPGLGGCATATTRTRSTGRILVLMAEPVAAPSCPVCDGQPRILVAMTHEPMLRFTRELLEREFGCWVTTEIRAGEALADTVARVAPDLLIIDAGAFPSCCVTALSRMSRDHVIVIGPEPDPSYRAAALTNGAEGWLPRERVGEDLAAEMRRILGCAHEPCPPGESRHPRGSPTAHRLAE